MYSQLSSAAKPNMSQKYFAFLGRFCLNFVLAFIIMRMIYLYVGSGTDAENASSVYIPTGAVNNAAESALSRVASITTRASSTVSRQRNGHFNSPKFKHDNISSTALRTDIRRLNTSHKPRRRSNSASIRSAYSDLENAVTPAPNVDWGTFVTMPMQPPRTHQTIPFNFFNELRICSTTAPSSTLGFNGLSFTNSSKSSTTSSSIVRKGCNDIWADTFISTWKNRMVKDLCEDNMNSKIRCFDSVTKSRFCIFDNVMMNFRKMRKRKQVDNSHAATTGATSTIAGRSWERGFLAADCGDMAPDNIGYLPLYKPDIEGRDGAKCDFTFNETVLMYSHDNIRNFRMMITDYLNVWSMVWLSGINRQTRDVTLFNIDGIKRSGRFTNDHINQFFKHYDVSFRRTLRAVDFTEKYNKYFQANGNNNNPNHNPKLCFKRLIVQPRPVLQFQWDGIDDPSCPAPAVSALFQRWNLQIRNNYGLLVPQMYNSNKNKDSSNNADYPVTNGDHVNSKEQEVLQILLITRSLRSTTNNKSPDVNTNSNAAEVSTAAVPPHIAARVFRNDATLITQLTQFLETYTTIHSEFNNIHTNNNNNNVRSNLHNPIRFQLVVRDLSLLSFEEQVKVTHAASVIVGMHGTGIAGMVHMAIGAPYCCGIVEIIPASISDATTTTTSTATSSTVSASNRGYGHLARRLGHVYERVDLPASATTLPQSTNLTANMDSSSGGENSTTELSYGSEVPIDRLTETLKRVLQRIVTGGEASCLLAEVEKTPYL